MELIKKECSYLTSFIMFKMDSMLILDAMTLSLLPIPLILNQWDGMELILMRVLPDFQDFSTQDHGNPV